MAGIIEIIDSLVINHENIGKGFKVLTKGNSYLVAKDKEDEVVCFVLNSEHSTVLIEKYLQEKGINKEEISFQEEFMKGQCDRYKAIADKKLCVLDKELMLFKDVVEASNSKEIVRFKKDMPKHGFNVYKSK